MSAFYEVSAQASHFQIDENCTFEIYLQQTPMKLYWTMPSGLRTHFIHELKQYDKAFADGDLAAAWQHLERAHVLGQPWPKEHNHVHWLMLKFGFHIKDSKEILGQIPRLLIGGVKSFVGHIPVGNTGGANVPPLKAMEIPEDLAELLNKFKHA